MTRRPFAFWVQHFEHNRHRLLPIPWDSPYRLTGEERLAVGGSVAAFQLGETGGGSFLRRAAARTGDPDYVRAIELFVAEEGRHARDLGRFMELEGIPLRRHHWTNAVFRRLRKLLGLELCVMVLLTAETIACVYYRALRDATSSPVLRDLCRQILRDEVAHVAFQTEALLSRPRRAALPVGAFRRVLLEATVVAVWTGHRRCLRAGGFAFVRFRREVLRTAALSGTPRPVRRLDHRDGDGEGGATMRRYLVVANQTLGGEPLLDELRGFAERGEAAFHVLVPATHPKDQFTWTEGEATAIAAERLERAMERFGELGAEVTGEVGAERPVDAIGDVLRRREVDEIVLSTLPAGPSRWLGQDLPSRVERSFDLPVTHVITEPEQTGADQAG